MSLDEVFDFLRPHGGDLLQIFFAMVILLMLVLSMGYAHWRARPASWEKKWNREASMGRSDDLDIEHGSVTDLWYAVATPAEKLAEVMPGLLLVVGLLGTFLGLGLALNHASNILSRPEAMSASGAASSMNDLLGLLQGLGTKFKTSTWGILGFVVLKIWSESVRFEEKRLAWVIDKVKQELEKRRAKAHAAEQARQAALFEQIHLASRNIVEGGMAAQNKIATVLNKALSVQIGNAATSVANDVKEQIRQTGKAAASIVEVLREQGRATADAVASMAAAGTQMSEAATRMSGGAEQVRDAAGELERTVGSFKDEFKALLTDVRDRLGQAIKEMSENSAEAMREGSGRLREAAEEIRQSLASLSQELQQVLAEVQTSIKESLAIQKNASIEFVTMSQALQEQIETTRSSFEAMSEKIGSGLTAVSKAGQRMESIGKSLERQAPALENIAGRLEKNEPPEMLRRALGEFLDLMVALQKYSRDNGELLRDMGRKVESGAISAVAVEREMHSIAQSLEQQISILGRIALGLELDAGPARDAESLAVEEPRAEPLEALPA